MLVKRLLDCIDTLFPSLKCICKANCHPAVTDHLTSTVPKLIRCTTKSQNKWILWTQRERFLWFCSLEERVWNNAMQHKQCHDYVYTINFTSNLPTKLAKLLASPGGVPCAVTIAKLRRRIWETMFAEFMIFWFWWKVTMDSLFIWLPYS